LTKSLAFDKLIAGVHGRGSLVCDCLATTLNQSRPCRLKFFTPENLTQPQ